jgi:hypothetical protein
MQVTDKKVYPSIAQSWGIFGIAIVSMLVFIPINGWLTENINGELGLLAYYLLSMAGPLLFAHFLRKKLTGKSIYSLKSANASIVIIVSLCIVGLQMGFTMPIGSLIPMPEVVKQLFLEMLKYNGILGFITIVIAAPILEELIFRGIILDGLLKRYSPTKSILFSSFLFGLVHLNPWQFISAMIIGCFAGWVYYRTKNLLLCILIHFINNLLPFIEMQFMDANLLMDMSLSEQYGGGYEAIAVVSTAVFVALGGIYYLKKIFDKLPSN